MNKIMALLFVGVLGWALPAHANEEVPTTTTLACFDGIACPVDVTTTTTVPYPSNAPAIIFWEATVPPDWTSTTAWVPPADLPSTGVEVRVILYAALLVVVVGWVMCVARRR